MNKIIGLTAITIAIAASVTAFAATRGAFRAELRTEIDIDAEPERVWATLLDFERFPAWNPMIREAEGRVAVGERLTVMIQPEGGSAMTFRPTVTKVEDRREFRWLGTLGVRGLFDGEHVFTIVPTGDGHVRFVHREVFSGALLPLLMPFIEKDTRRGFDDMNRALKDRMERSA